ncbi:acyl-CoA dehydrogenase [Methyloceanibacter superfactus]|uniref:acyl-CoA dehydrogenase n=1 Tax=Methyloceanibacter superfactus TaxID=1774969 RepID=UPI000AC14ADD|nr:acyl-CoA dehydrogenase [Methyloceanibacter superfactus]
MAELIFAALSLAAFLALAMNRASLRGWAIAIAVFTVILQFGFGFTLWSFAGWLVAGLLFAASVPDIKRKYITLPAYGALKGAMPTISDTEREALQAGTIGWDAELFSGEPDFAKLRRVAPITLTDEERAFLDGPTDELCKRLDDWRIRHELHDIPDDIWEFVCDNGFLGMLISKEHGGLGFSAQAQSLILGKISSRSADSVTIVMVPNSLGPGELIEKYGTETQKAHYLPRLARGEEIPCFALTGPFSGSDAAAMRDVGVVTKGMHEGKETLGVKLTWDKRYITLAPKATLLGLAFRLFDPDNLLGKGADIGITLGLVPTDHPGARSAAAICPRARRSPTGPPKGREVFVPLDWIIGGPDGAGQGWRMLMNCLAAGRSISLPATSAACAKAMLRRSTAYARIRKQFGLPIGFMEGVEEPLARLAENAYGLEAARAVTASMVSAGEKPAVISALLKYMSTDRMRDSVNDALDIHGGRGICDGPSNYIQGAYQMVPVGITVEGANILTRTLITFAQGALRSHPYLFAEIEALQDSDRERGIEAFEKTFDDHRAFLFSNAAGALFHNVTFGAFAGAPNNGGDVTKWWKQLSRASRSFALVADLTVALLGGGLKVKQKITGRMADALAELYLLSSILKRYEDDGRPKDDLKLVNYCARNCLARFDQALRGVIDNFPVRWAAWIMGPLVMPFGMRRPAPDRDAKAIVRAALTPGAFRDRLTRDIYASEDASDGIGLLEATLKKVVASEEAEKKLERAIRKGEVKRFHDNDWIAEAETKGVLTPEEARNLATLRDMVARVIAVDDFSAAELQRAAKSDQPKHMAAE